MMTCERCGSRIFRREHSFVSWDGSERKCGKCSGPSPAFLDPGQRRFQIEREISLHSKKGKSKFLAAVS